jgi:hypothetical protein
LELVDGVHGEAEHPFAIEAYDVAAGKHFAQSVQNRVDKHGMDADFAQRLVVDYIAAALI